MGHKRSGLIAYFSRSGGEDELIRGVHIGDWLDIRRARNLVEQR